MIRKFKDFDAESFIGAKKALKESIDDDRNFNVSDMDGLKPVYTDPYLKKIASIVKKRLDSAKIGKFGTNYSIVYLNGVPGVWFYGLDDNESNIVCCRDTNGKTIAVFDTFKINDTNVAKITYSTKKLGFKDMIDELVFDLQNPVPVEEGVINEAVRYGDGWTVDNVKRFEKLPWEDKDYTYDFIRKFGKGKAVTEFYDMIASKDSVACKILKTFVGGELKPGEGQTRYLMSFADSVVNVATGGRVALSIQKAVDSGILDNLVSEYKGGAPAIRTSSGISYEVEDEDEEMAARMEEIRKRKERELAENAEEYRDTLEEMEAMTRAMCHYVKQHGQIDKNDMSAMSKRAYLLTGRGGTGKTHTLMKVLKEENMKKNNDYIIMGSNETTSEALYSVMYQYNGKLIIFDDAPKIFAGEYRESFWKHALQTEAGTSEVRYPKDGSAAVYDVMSKYTNRQKMYYSEIGHKSDDDMREFWKKKAKEYGSDVKLIIGTTTGEYRLKKTIGSSLTDAEVSTLNDKVKKEWDEEQSTIKPLMPNSFVFNGVVIIITNKDGDSYKTEMGDASWKAIMSRFEYFNINPSAFALWDEMKKIIMNEFNDSSIPDDMVSIPRDMTEEFIEEVDELIQDPDYQDVTYRMLDQFHRVLGGDFGKSHWKKKLKRTLLTNK